jgi:hypothetical protein
MPGLISNVSQKIHHADSRTFESDLLAFRLALQPLVRKRARFLCALAGHCELDA